VSPGATRVVQASLVGTGVLAALAGAAVVAPDAMALPYAAVSLLLFLLGCGAFFWAYATAVSRSRTEVVTVPGVWFLSGTAPRPVRWRLIGSLLAEIVIVLVAAGIEPFTAVAFGVLAPVYGLGLVGLWGARYGEHPPRAAG